MTQIIFFLKFVLATLWMHFIALLGVVVYGLTWGKGEGWIRCYLVARGAVVLLRIYGIRVEVEGNLPICSRPNVWICNHRSSLDIFIILSLGLPRVRYFLSDYLRKIPAFFALGGILRCVWIMDQDRRAERVAVFQNAAKVLLNSGDDVFLTPEGRRIDSKLVGPFNKGAFHLAMDLQRSIMPIFIDTPDHVSPGIGSRAQSGTVRVKFLKEVESPSFSEEKLREFVSSVRAVYLVEGSQPRNSGFFRLSGIGKPNAARSVKY